MFDLPITDDDLLTETNGGCKVVALHSINSSEEFAKLEGIPILNIIVLSV